jgi:hypothetical protein
MKEYNCTRIFFNTNCETIALTNLLHSEELSPREREAISSGYRDYEYYRVNQYVISK